MRPMKNTKSELIEMIKTLGGHPFTDSDWDAFAGCESSDPHILHAQNYSIIVDDDKLVFIYGEDMDNELILQMV